ncbi:MULTISPECIES: hypothetical protein [Geobacillus]|jgi:hypothetical protein|uniref:DUF3794 domain-containing protein n=2 Tax=Geobacillus thermodenitrificans TaxID=33940 RepID=A4INL5_GEOTN|nr:MULTISPECIES: hypothetical protein [Geobacillus]ABO66919.1 Conserved hypothetical protein [Geobacillus thermodenitrificans NG80-2]ARA96739.1 hypothetical protein GD3902_00995 [Geobacillus thermodenitrificans]ARP42688.1 hypothetical protein GTHT12_01135 [Geobacillus thermodenitrificans]ATO36011.1 hypothetical protein GTID1_01555 [Geobacillus thermodenitrificans]KQB93487.1 hypothetical protein GEPA3_1629 [Geobacillus sp. PA-3]
MPINLEQFAQQFDPECIQVCKVYDWTTHVVQLAQDITFTFPEGALADITISQVNCAVTMLECAEDVRRDIECTVGNQLVTLQAVTLSKTIQIVLEVTGTNTDGAQVTVLSNPALITTTEEVILCAPEGTTVCCNATQNAFNNCRVGSFTQNGDSITANVSVRICQSIVVTYEVILEVAARFCQPRPEIICEEECPVDVFPPQCPAVFPTMM